GCGIEACGEANKNGNADAEQDEPQGNRGNGHAGKILAVQINVGAKGKSAANEPAENSSNNAAEKAHHTGFDKEKLLDVSVGGAKSFQDTNFTSALEDRHDQGVDDTKSRDRKC